MKKHNPVERRLTVTTQPSSSSNGKVLPALRFGGQILEAAGFRVGKKITLKVQRHKITITLDKPGPDPQIDQRYQKIKENRDIMQEASRKLIEGSKASEKRRKRRTRYANAKLYRPKDQTRSPAKPMTA